MFWAICFAAAALPSAYALPMSISDNILPILSLRDEDISDDDISGGGDQFHQFPITGIIGIVVPIIVIGLLLAFFRTAIFTAGHRNNNGYMKTSEGGSTLPIYQREKCMPSPTIVQQTIMANPATRAPLPREPPPAYTPTYTPKFNNAAASEWPRPQGR